MKRLFKLLISGFTMLGLAVSAVAQADLTYAASVTANTPVTLLTGGKYQIYNITFFNSSNAVSVLKFYDSIGNSVSNVQAAYTSYATVATNWSTVFTNAEGIIITNTFTGVAEIGTAVAATTNLRPTKVNFAVAGSGNRTVNVSWLPALGVTVNATTSGLVEVGYKQIAP
jgi:hypothetical protein